MLGSSTERRTSEKHRRFRGSLRERGSEIEQNLADSYPKMSRFFLCSTQVVLPALLSEPRTKALRSKRHWNRSEVPLTPLAKPRYVRGSDNPEPFTPVRSR